jgi:hypothetical protein
MIHNEAHAALLRQSGRVWWDEQTQILQLTAFIASMDMTTALEAYLTAAADEELESSACLECRGDGFAGEPCGACGRGSDAAMDDFVTNRQWILTFADQSKYHVFAESAAIAQRWLPMGDPVVEQMGEVVAVTEVHRGDEGWISPYDGLIEPERFLNPVDREIREES